MCGALWENLIWWNSKKIAREILQSYLDLKEINGWPSILNGVLGIWGKPSILDVTQALLTLFYNMLDPPLDLTDATALTMQTRFLTQLPS